QHLRKDFDQRLAKAALQNRQELEAERAALQAEIAALTSRADASERRLREEQQSRQGAQRAAQIEQELRAAQDQAEAAQRRQEALSRQQLEDVRRAAAAEAEENLRSARERWNADLTRAVQQAREDWSKEQDGVLGTLRAQHERHCAELVAGEREKIAVLEAALATSKTNGSEHNTAALETLSDQLAAAGRALAERERELEDAKAQLDRERTGQKADQQADQLLQQERGNWRSQENSLREQLSTLQAQADAQIASLTARCREAEARTSRNSWGTAIKDKARIDALTLEVASLRTALAKQASAPAHDRSNGGFQTAASLEEPKQAGRSKKALLRDFCIAVCCITPLILFYPRVMSSVHAFMSDDPPAPIVAATPRSDVPPLAALKARMATVVRGVNMRKTASAGADVVFTLKKGAAVEILSTSGKWTEVGVKGQDGAGARGWVYNTYLQADGTN
ncbi:MAG TPA: SH3 domain-containing protein, partial [Rhizomicrobium sp.]